MEKTILNRGYVTNALTNENGEIYGLIKEHYINFAANSIEMKHKFYWSEVYCEVGVRAMIIRKGVLLVNPTPEELSNYHEQSKINLN